MEINFSLGISLCYFTFHKLKLDLKLHFTIFYISLAINLSKKKNINHLIDI